LVQLYSGGGPPGDPVGCPRRHQRQSREDVRTGLIGPSPALLKDLKQRGLLHSTLIVWTRRVWSNAHVARWQGPRPQSVRVTRCGWLAGRGVKGGQAVGGTDEFGLRAVTERISVKRIFTRTMLASPRTRHEQLTYLHSGRDERLTDVAGAAAVHKVLQCNGKPAAQDATRLLASSSWRFRAAFYRQLPSAERGPYPPESRWKGKNRSSPQKQARENLISAHATIKPGPSNMVAPCRAQGDGSLLVGELVSGGSASVRPSACSVVGDPDRRSESSSAFRRRMTSGDVGHLGSRSGPPKKS